MTLKKTLMELDETGLRARSSALMDKLVAFDDGKLELSEEKVELIHKEMAAIWARIELMEQAAANPDDEHLKHLVETWKPDWLTEQYPYFSPKMRSPLPKTLSHLELNLVLTPCCETTVCGLSSSQHQIN